MKVLESVTEYLGMKLSIYQVAYPPVVGHYHRCGYLELPEGHPLIGYDDFDLPLEVHGGITYHQGRTIRFDCAHSDDSRNPKSSAHKSHAFVLAQLTNLAEQVSKIKERPKRSAETILREVRDLTYETVTPEILAQLKALIAELGDHK